MFRTLNTRLIFSHLAVALVSVILVYAFAGRAIFQAAEQQAENRLEDLAFATSNALEEPMHNFLEGEVSLNSVQVAVAHWLADEPELHYTVYLPEGTPIVDNMDATPTRASVDSAPEVLLALQDGIGEGHTIRYNQFGDEMFYVAVRIEHEDELLGLLRLGIPTQNVFAPARGSVSTLFLFMLFVVVSVGIAGWLLGRTIAAPVDTLTRTAHQFSAGDLSVRTTPAGPHELQQLAETFNSMAGRLEHNINQLRAFVANASHELRTPLTAIRLRVEALQAGATQDPQVSQRFLAEMESEIDRLTNMVNDLLDLSRIEAGMDTERYEWVDLAILVQETSDIFCVRAQKKGITLEQEHTADTSRILGHEDQLRRAVDNLVANALEYTPEGGRVFISLHPTQGQQGVQLAICDTGPGIAEKHLPHIFDRFFRISGTDTRTQETRSTGLGLAIVKSIVEAHRGRITVHSKLGEGTTFTITLPCRRDDTPRSQHGYST
ncbi:MAG: HAMP domain-containing histidine kinase [Anaerolineae bacterium]|nr:HAMP domain-containing histidine kinase [Anaerolineae bacterium]